MSAFWAAKYLNGLESIFNRTELTHEEESWLSESPELVADLIKCGYEEEACHILTFLGSQDKYHEHFYEAIYQLPKYVDEGVYFYVNKARKEIMSFRRYPVYTPEFDVMNIVEMRNYLSGRIILCK